jgi:hypothetical protein
MRFGAWLSEEWLREADMRRGGSVGQDRHGFDL